MEEEKNPICATFASTYMYTCIYVQYISCKFVWIALYACCLCPLIPLASFVLLSFRSWRWVLWNESLKVYKTLWSIESFLLNFYGQAPESLYICESLVISLAVTLSKLCWTNVSLDPLKKMLLYPGKKTSFGNFLSPLRSKPGKMPKHAHNAGKKHNCMWALSPHEFQVKKWEETKTVPQCRSFAALLKLPGVLPA